jgi:hypothetical protein
LPFAPNGADTEFTEKDFNEYVQKRNFVDRDKVCTRVTKSPIHMISQ